MGTHHNHTATEEKKTAIQDYLNLDLAPERLNTSIVIKGLLNGGSEHLACLDSEHLPTLISMHL